MDWWKEIELWILVIDGQWMGWILLLGCGDDCI